MLIKNIFCPNEKCKCFKKLNAGNLKVKQVQGKCQSINLLMCKECGETFSERRGTVYFGLKKSNEVFDLVITLLVTRLSIKDIAKISKVSEDTISRWILKASPVLESIQSCLLKGLEVKECQVDELWSFVLMKNKTVKSRGLEDTDDIGDQWIFIAFDAVNKLVIHWKVGKRTLETAKCFIKELKEKLASSPLFTTDELPAYEQAFLSNFSEELPAKRTGKPGRPRKKTIIKVNDDLKLAQVHKYRENGKVSKVSTKYVFGKQEEIDDIIKKSKVSQTINTTFIERFNGTIRAKASRLVRETYSFSKTKPMHLAHLSICFVHYNLSCVHSRLKKTPATLSGLVNKDFSFRELFELRCPEFICGY